MIDELNGSGTNLTVEYAPTAADHLLTRLESDPQFTFTFLYGQYESGLLKVYKKKKDKDGSQPIEYVHQNEISCNLKDGDTVQTYDDQVRDSLGITG